MENLYGLLFPALLPFTERCTVLALRDDPGPFLNVAPTLSTMLLGAVTATHSRGCLSTANSICSRCWGCSLASSSSRSTSCIRSHKG
jgi:hypothetical protein